MAVNNKSKLYVLDCSALSSIILPDEEKNPSIQKIFRLFSKNKIMFVSPTLLKFEIGNVLKTCIKRNRANKSKVIEIYKRFLKLPISYIDQNPTSIMSLSIKHNLTFYDASYLALSIEKNAKLLTLDKKLQDCLKTE